MVFKSPFSALPAVLLLASCVEEVGGFEADSSSLVVIDAALSAADSTHTVYISHGGPWTSPDVDYRWTTDYDAVDTRLVTLTDDRGRIDTFDVSPNGRVCTLLRPDMEVGRTYRLDVVVGDRKFHAEQTVRPRPLVKGIKFQPMVAEKDGAEYWVPILFFDDAEPGATNYYLIHKPFSNSYSRTGRALWDIEAMVLSDANLGQAVEGLRLAKGLGEYEQEQSVWVRITYGGWFTYALSSVSREVYDYYFAMRLQLMSDGGNYMPNPSSPRTNFVGDDVQGLFVVADTYVFSGVMDYRYILQ